MYTTNINDPAEYVHLNRIHVAGLGTHEPIDVYMHLESGRVLEVMAKAKQYREGPTGPWLPLQ